MSDINTSIIGGEGDGDESGSVLEQSGEGAGAGAAGVGGAGAAPPAPAGSRGPNARGGAQGQKTLRAKALAVVEIVRRNQVVEIPPGEEFEGPADRINELVQARFAKLVGQDDAVAEKGAP